MIRGLTTRTLTYAKALNWDACFTMEADKEKQERTICFVLLDHFYTLLSLRKRKKRNGKKHIGREVRFLA